MSPKEHCSLRFLPSIQTLHKYTQSVLFELLKKSPKLVRFFCLVLGIAQLFTSIWQPRISRLQVPGLLLPLKKEYLKSKVLYATINTSHPNIAGRILGRNWDKSQLFTVTSSTDFTPPVPLSKSG
jgi:hypothetical protein